jgi:hypothetical protein
MHATRYDMISSQAGGRVVAARLQARALSMQREWAWKSAIRHRAGVSSRPEGAARRRAAVDDGVLILGVVALVALLVLGVIVMLLAWTTASLPYGVRIACPELDDCRTAGPDPGPSGWSDDPRADAAGMMR